MAFKTKASARRASKRWRDNHRDKCKEQKLLKRYGLTLTKHDEMYRSQQCLCGMCGQYLSYEEAHVDHCHTTGKIRSLVHDQCNRLEGMLNQCTDEHIQSILKYREKHKTNIIV